ncbi:MAG TPA: CBS domain-containing protein [Burkholderiales bacterium]|nr:CBS domain-containing protein [Burkholderiales bacterium]
MRIGRVCNREVTVAYEDERIDEIAKRMRERHVGSVIVLARGGRMPAGVITDRDIVVEVVAAGLDARSVSVGEVMSRDPVAVREDDDVVDALRVMRTHGVRRLPVLSSAGTLAGIVAIDDLLELVAGQVDDLVRAIGREQTREAQVRN